MSLLRKASIVTTPTSYENGKILSVKPSIVLGNELVVNGTFQTDSDWNKGAGWTISNGIATNDGTINSIYQQELIEIGKKYICKVDITFQSAGVAYWRLGNTTNLGVMSVGGTITQTLTGSSNGSYIGIFTNAQITIDNVSVKEVLDADFQFTRNSSATRTNSQGLIEDMQILSGDLVSNGDFSQEGSQLITNGNFATDSDWGKSSNWTISGGAANSNGSNGAIYQNIGLVSGKTYKVNVEVSLTSGSLYVREGNNGSVAEAITQSGSYEIYLISGTATSQVGYIQFYSISFNGSISNISVKEVGQDWTFVNADISIGNNGLEIISQGGNRPQANQIISGLTVGNKYKLSAIAKRGTCVSSVEIEISGIGSTVTTNQNNTTEFANIFYEFIANSTSHTIQAKINDGASATGETAFFKSVSLIEITEDTNLPRIDYTGGEGHWLFEPQTSQLVTYSEDFSNAAWTKNVVTLESGYLAPDGTNNAYKVSGSVNMNDVNITGLVATSTRSIYARTVSGTGTAQLLTHNSNTNNVFTITEQWQRFEVSTANATFTSFFYAIDFRGVGTLSEIILWGANATNDQNFATSYIPTEGSIKTRLQDTASGAGSSDLINSTEGVLYFEGSALANDSYRYLSLSDGSNSNNVRFNLSPTANQISFEVNSGGSLQLGYTNNSTDVLSNTKIAIKYKLNDFAVWINGFEVNTNSSGITPTGLNTLNFDRGTGGNVFLGKTKCVAVFKEALTNDELECLTGEGYDSFNALALANNYTII